MYVDTRVYILAIYERDIFRIKNIVSLITCIQICYFSPCSITIFGAGYKNTIVLFESSFYMVYITTLLPRSVSNHTQSCQKHTYGDSDLPDMLVMSTASIFLLSVEKFLSVERMGSIGGGEAGGRWRCDILARLTLLVPPIDRCVGVSELHCSRCRCTCWEFPARCRSVFDVEMFSFPIGVVRV